MSAKIIKAAEWERQRLTDKMNKLLAKLPPSFLDCLLAELKEHSP